MNGYFLAEVATSRHTDLLRTAEQRRLAALARPARRSSRGAARAGGTERPGGLRHPVAAARAFLVKGWIAPPSVHRGVVPGDGRGVEAANLAFGPAGAATCFGLRQAAGHGAG